MSDRRFYVYEHWRPDRDECFYVGKGHGRRANAMSGRNRHHQNIQAKLARMNMCVEVRMVAFDLTEDEAFALEIERITVWRSDGAELANLTDGGEGSYGASEETRALMRAAKVGRKLTPETKAKIAVASRAALADPEVRARLGGAIRLGRSTPEAKAKASASQKTRVRTKEHYEKVSAALTGRKLSPEHAAKARAASLGRKQTSEEIERRRKATTGKKRTADFSERMSALWTPERRTKHAIHMAERNRARAANKVMDK